MTNINTKTAGTSVEDLRTDMMSRMVRVTGEWIAETEASGLDVREEMQAVIDRDGSGFMAEFLGERFPQYLHDAVSA